MNHLLSSGKHMLEALKLWRNYKIKNDQRELHKARHMAVTAINGGAASLGLYLLNCFFCLELGLEDCKDVLDNLNTYKNYFKQYEPDSYACYLYLTALVGVHFDKPRQTKKALRQLEELSENDKSNIYPLLIGRLLLGMGEVKEAGLYFTMAYRYGCVSTFLFDGLFEYFNATDEVLETRQLLVPFINWALAHDADISAVIVKHNAVLTDEISQNIKLCKKMYTRYPGEWLLTVICNYYIRSGAYEPSVVNYYQEAIKRQLFISGLNYHFMKAAVEHQVKDVGKYPMEDYLKTNKPPLEDRPFVYHLLLSSKKMTELAELYKNDILQFAFICLERRMMGYYYNSIYKFFLEQPVVNSDYVSQAENIISTEMLQVDLYASAEAAQARFVYVKEKGCRDYIEYPLINGYARVRASSENLSYYCVDQTKREIINHKLTIKRAVENEDYALYRYFYKKGRRDDVLLLAMARHCLSLSSPNDEAVEIFVSCLKNSKLTKKFKMQVSAALGNFLYQQNDLAHAMDYFKNIDEAYLNDRFVETMFTIYMDTGKYDAAVGILSKKPQCVSDKATYTALKKLLTFEEYQDRLADVAYRLILNSWYDKSLVELVLKKYRGGIKQWEDLSNTLANISVYDFGLDEIILRNSLWTRQLDEGAQKIFLRMYDQQPSHELVGRYTMFICYEMLIHKFKPTYEVLAALEKLYLSSRSGILCYSLCACYIHHWVTTFHSDEIISGAYELMLAEGNYLPFFKDYKPISKPNVFFEKHTPLMYSGTPDKNIYVYYRFDSQETYTKKKMKYFRFGLYLAAIPHFSGERMHYYFNEEAGTGSISTKEKTALNDSLRVHEEEDLFLTVNNALIYEQMFKYDQVEAIITRLLDNSQDYISTIVS